MKVRAIINFNDMEAKEKRIAGESEWECSEERAKFLLEHNAIEIIEEPVKESEIEIVEPPVEVKEVKKPRKTKKKVESE